MIVDHLEMVSVEPFFPVNLDPRLRRMMLDPTRYRPHIFQMDGQWVYHAPFASCDYYVLMASIFCIGRNS